MQKAQPVAYQEDMRFTYAQGRARKVLESTTVSVPRMVLEEASGVVSLSPNTKRVDTENRVIRGVKIIGLESRNIGRVLGLSEREFGEAVDQPYAYTMDCLRRAAPLYEGATVYHDHIEFGYTEDGHRYVKGDGRKNDDMAGWLTNVRAVEGKGLYADLNYYANGRGSDLLIEIATRRPDQLAMSHEAEFDEPQLINGKIYLTEIVAVNAVALVNGTPGTTNGLFEQHTQPKTREKTAMRRSLRKIIENSTKFTLGRRALLEMFAGDDGQLGPEADMLEVDFGGDADAVSDDEQVRAGMLATISNLLDTADIAKLEAVLKSLSADGETVTEMEGEVLPEGELLPEGEVLPEVAEMDTELPKEEEDVVAELDSEIVPEDDKVPVVAECDAEHLDNEKEEIVAETESEVVAATDEAKPKVVTISIGERARRVKQRSEAAFLDCLDVLEKAGAPRDREIVEAMLGMPVERRKAYATKIAALQVSENIVAFPSPRSQAATSGVRKAVVAAEEVAKKYEAKGSFAEKVRRG